VVGLQGMFWDITDIKLAEQRITKAKDELAASEELLREKNAQMENDLTTAREVQLAMLPQQYPVLPRGVSPDESAFHFTHRYLPSGTVGGDFFSVTPISDLEVAVFVCDVAGHGVRSALITTMIRALVEDLRPIAHDPGPFMTELNSKLFAILKPGGSTVLTTAFYLVANSVTGQMRYVNAGHPKPFLIRRAESQVEEIKSQTQQKSQAALGVFENFTYQNSEIKLTARDLVMLFTDGLYEVHTREMLLTAAQQNSKLPAAQLFDMLLREVQDFATNHAFEDDICIVGMEFHETGPAKPR
jgi:serine phosphatase RsbU (regulator of sigma subunit)